MKTFTYLTLTSFIITSLFLSSCSPVHVINPHNVPGFTQEKETRISGGISVQNYILGVGAHLNFAHSFTDKFAFIAGGSTVQTGWSNIYYANIGLGYYKPLNTNMVFENYIGYGNGRSKDDQTKEYRQLKTRYASVFNQSSITIRSENSTLEGVFSLRLSKIHHYNIVDHYVYATNDTNALLKNPDTFLIEPSFILRAGANDLKFETYMNLLALVSNRNNENYGYFSKIAIGTGLVYSFKPIDKTKM